jgi:hypothetical protein
MSESKRSFFSTIPGLITGLAGLLTGIVGLVTVLIQLGVLGGDDDSSVNATGASSTTVAGGGTSGGGTSGGGGATTTTELATFTASPTTLDFGPADKEKTVTIKNTSSTAPITVSQPRLTGDDASNFSVALDSCNRPLAADLSCTVKVTFAPTGNLRRYSATLQIEARGAPRGAEVKLTGSSLLGG